MPTEEMRGPEKIKLKILVLDDSPAMRILLEKMLGPRYSSVETFKNRKFLMDKLLESGEEFGFVIVDNLEAAKEVYSQNPKIPIIILTTTPPGTEFNALAIEAGKLGEALCLNKPPKLKPEELYSWIDSMVDKKKRQA